jgi:putative iron-regulated protein
MRTSFAANAADELLAGIQTVLSSSVRRGASAALGCMLLASCGGDDSKHSTHDVPPVLENYAAILYAGYDDSLTGAKSLQKALQPLLDGTATQSDLDAARKAWRSARVPYQQTEYGRFYNGPIDDPSTGNLEGMINPWPLDEATIDYVLGPKDETLFMGIVNMPDDFPKIDSSLLVKDNMVPGEENVTTGYHAIEFLLWGQDFDPNGPGARPYEDYVPGKQENVDRRQTYLKVTAQLLIDQLQKVRDAWAGDADYRKTFVTQDPLKSLGLILTGMGKFASGELAGQRIFTAYTSKDQEDEHSCFSDNTDADLMDDVLGLSNLYYGRYKRPDGSTLSGASLSDIVKARDADLDARVRTQVDQALADIRAWPKVDDCPSKELQGKCPFDQLILGNNQAPGRQALAKVVTDLHALATSVSDIADLFDIQIDISDSGNK